MIKSTLIDKIASYMTFLPEKHITLAVNEIITLMRESLSKGERIEIRGFGSFSLRFRKARKTRNPKTGITMPTPSKFTPHFKPGKELRERVNQSNSYK